MQIFKSASTAMLTVGEVEEREGGREGVVVRRASHHDAAGRGQRADRSSGRRLVAGFRRHTMAAAVAATAAKQHHCRKGREREREGKNY